MTKKDYILIAKSFNCILGGFDIDKKTFDRIANQLAYALKKDNSAFDRNRFLTACGLIN